MRSDRLQRIIGLKEQLMEEKKRVLDDHSRELEVILRNINALSDEIHTNYQEFYTIYMDGKQFSVLKDYLEHLRRLKTHAQEQRERVEGAIAIIKAELYEMYKEIKVLETLREQTRSAAKRVQNKKQQKLLDEIALRLEGRKS